MTLTKPTIHSGGIYNDQRGVLEYVNELDPGYYRRFYLITHPDINVVRGWQGHKKEEKGFFAISGNFIIAVVHPKNFEAPDENETPEFFTLTSENNHFLRVPGGCYTGIKALSPGSTLLVLSGFDLAALKKMTFVSLRKSGLIGILFLNN